MAVVLLVVVAVAVAVVAVVAHMDWLMMMRPSRRVEYHKQVKHALHTLQQASTERT